MNNVLLKIYYNSQYSPILGIWLDIAPTSGQDSPFEEELRSYFVGYHQLTFNYLTLLHYVQILIKPNLYKRKIAFMPHTRSTRSTD